VSVFSPDGRRVKVLEHGARQAGTFSVTWDGTDESGRRVPNGVYVCRFTAPSVELTRKLVLVRDR